MTVLEIRVQPVKEFACREVQILQRMKLESPVTGELSPRTDPKRLASPGTPASTLGRRQIRRESNNHIWWIALSQPQHTVIGLLHEETMAAAFNSHFIGAALLWRRRSCIVRPRWPSWTDSQRPVHSLRGVIADRAPKHISTRRKLVDTEGRLVTGQHNTTESDRQVRHVVTCELQGTATNRNVVVPQRRVLHEEHDVSGLRDQILWKVVRRGACHLQGDGVHWSCRRRFSGRTEFRARRGCWRGLGRERRNGGWRRRGRWQLERCPVGPLACWCASAT